MAEGNQYEKLNDDLLRSTSSKEVSNYTEEIIHLLNNKVDSSQNQNPLSTEQRKQYDEWLEKMLEATHPKEVKYYEDKILELLEETASGK